MGGDDGGRSRRRDRSLWFGLGAIVVAAVVLVVALAVGGRSDDGAAAVPCPGADGRPRELRRCLTPSVAFVETPWATGSAVLVEGGYLVTNAHVVDPFEHADVTFDGGERHDGVPVVGIDAFADIAVLGPVETDHDALAIAAIDDLEEREDSEVFLVGYPGGIEDDSPQLSLSGGLLSRTREDTTFGHTYLQTDAAISGGQSGGALVDEDGQVLGISGLSFAEEFALALSSGDVADATARIQDGRGDVRRTFPADTDDTVTSLTTRLTTERPDGALMFPAGGSDDEIELVVADDAPVAIDVYSLAGEPLGSNEASDELNEQYAESDGWTFDPDDVVRLDEPEPGHYRVEVAADEDVIAYVTRVDEDVDLDLTATAPFRYAESVLDGERVELGRPLRAVVDGFTIAIVHPVQLREGDRVRIEARGGASDAWFTLLAPGEEYDPAAEVSADDGGGGLYDLDADDTFEIDETGEWRIVAGTYDGVVGGYQLSVERD